MSDGARFFNAFVSGMCAMAATFFAHDGLLLLALVALLFGVACLAAAILTPRPR